MNTSGWLKSPDALVTWQRGGAGLRLVNQATRQTHLLGPVQAASWLEWDDPAALFTDGGTEQSLRAAGLIVPDDSQGRTQEPLGVDPCVPEIMAGDVKWYEESPDLLLLFNTRRVSFNNPLLALGPYGSLCWRGIAAGRSIGQIRREALRVFGCDDVVAFLSRLAGLGFIKPLAGLDGCPPPARTVTKEFSAPDVQFQLSQSSVPWYCLWEVCTACDLRCQVCYLPHFKSAGPGREEAADLARKIIEAGVFYVCILGGEPLLRDDLEQLVRRFREAGVFTKIISNGQKLTRARADALAEAGLNQIEISFDGLSPETHEGSRGAGTFARTLEAVRHARQAGIPRVGTVWTVHTGNQHQLSSLPAFMLENGVTECYISLFKKTGLNGSRAPFAPVGAEFARLVRERIEGWRVEHPELTVVLLPGCSCGRTSVVIGYNGDIRLCSFSYEGVGNVYESSLLEVWRSLKAALPETGPLGYCTPPDARRHLAVISRGPVNG